MNKRGQGLPVTTVIVIILVVIVLVVVASFFLGGTASLTRTIRSVFFGTIAGTDKVLAVQTCQTRCDQAQVLPKSFWASSAFCTQPFYIDDDGDGEAERVNGEYKKFYCSSGSVTDTNKETHLGVKCPVDCSKPAEE